MKILIIEDDKNISDLVSFNLKREGYKAVPTPYGKEGLRLAREIRPSLILLDLMLPDTSGLDICKLLKANAETKNIPVIILTARSEEIDRVVGLEIGADDYVTKPFSVRELILRVKGVLRRRGEAAVPSEELMCDDLRVNVLEHRASIKGKELGLTHNEFKLLAALLRVKEKVISRDSLLNTVWGYSSSVSTRTVDTCVARLREKLGAYGKHLVSVRGVGYKWSGKC